MNTNLQNILTYHQETKHSAHRYARSLGYMDWATQPNPFREYKGSEVISLPLATNHTTPPYHLLDSALPAAPLLKESLSQLLAFSMGLAAWKISGDSVWAVRCNASSGNLHPTEAYLVLPPLLEEQNAKSSVFHYAPKEHTLEKLASFESDFWEQVPKNSFIIGLSSIVWREVWKYGERAFRYTNLDVGHAAQALRVSAKLLGWKLTPLESVSDTDIDTLLGLKQTERFFEKESGDMLFFVSCESLNPSISIDTLLESLPLQYEAMANKLSPSMHNWDIIPSIQNATSVMPIAQKSLSQTPLSREPTQEAKEVILKRRSVHIMDKETSTITQKQFHTILSSVSGSLNAKENAAHLVLFVHRVVTYESGLYILVRNQRDITLLKEQMHRAFEWKKTALENLYLLEARDDLEMVSKAISCSQNIASDGAFSLAMVCNFSQQLQIHGAHRYKELYWECGEIGQQLYLEATSLGLWGTGIGCFLDDMMHGLLGLKTNIFQSLYHFTVGRGYVDSRIQTKEAYAQREEAKSL